MPFGKPEIRPFRENLSRCHNKKNFLRLKKTSCPDFAQGVTINPEVAVRKKNEPPEFHALGGLQEVNRGSERHRGRLFDRVSVSPRAYGREGDAFNALIQSELQACPVSAGQNAFFAVSSVLVNRADRVYDVFGL